MIERTDGVTAAIRISQGIALQSNSLRSEAVRVAELRRDLWLVQVVTNITTRTPRATVVNRPRNSAVIEGSR
jgi:hypothetical protein